MKINNQSISAVVVVVAVITTSCSKTPTACFTADKVTVAVNEVVTLDASCSTSAHHYEWTFGDGAKAADAKTTHIYTTAGTYTVTLTGLSMNMKKTNQLTKVITVK